MTWPPSRSMVRVMLARSLASTQVLISTVGGLHAQVGM